MGDQRVERVARHGGHVERRPRLHRRGSRFVGDQRNFADHSAGFRDRDMLAIDEDIRLTIDHEVNPIAHVALVEDDLARFEMLASHLGAAKNANLRDVARQQQIHRPVGDDTCLAVPTGKLRQVNHPPQNPGQHARNLDTHNVGNSGSPAERGQRAERAKLVGLERVPRSDATMLPAQHFASRTACWAVGGGKLPFAERNSGTIAESPNAGGVFAVQLRIDRNPTAGFRQGQRFQQRMWLDRNRRHHRPSRYRCRLAGRLVLRNGSLLGHTGQARVEPNLDAATLN